MPNNELFFVKQLQKQSSSGGSPLDSHFFILNCNWKPS